MQNYYKGNNTDLKYIVKLEEALQNTNYVFIVMPYYNHGDLFDLVPDYGFIEKGIYTDFFYFFFYFEMFYLILYHIIAYHFKS